MLAIGAKLLGLFGLGDDMAKRFAWLPLLVIAGLLVWAGIAAFGSWQDRTIEQARAAGATGAVLGGHEVTLDQLEDANDAEQDLDAGGERSADRYAGCLRDSDRPAACERYRPLAD